MHNIHRLKLLLIFSVVLISHSLFSQEAQSYEGVLKSANERFEVKDYISAKTYYEMALRQKADDPFATKRLAETVVLMKKQLEQQEVFYNYLDQGDKLFKEGAVDQALVVYRKALEVFPEDKYVTAQVSKIESANKEKAQKKQQFEQYLQLGKQLFQTSKFEEALLQFNLAAEMDPQNTEIKNEINKLQQAINKRNTEEKAFSDLMSEADAFQKRKNYEQAIAKVNEAIDIFPTNQEASDKLKMLQTLALVQKNYNEAISKADQAYELKQLAQALDLYREALKIWPDQAYAAEMAQRIDQTINSEEAKRKKAIDDALHLADANFDQKQYEAALSNYNTVLGFDPENEKAGQRVIDITLLISAEKAALQVQKQFDAKMAEANQAFDIGSFEQALTLYKDAASLKPDEHAVKERISHTQDRISVALSNAAKAAEYQKLIADADILFNSEKYTEAKSIYEKALLVDATGTYPATQIESIDNIIEKQLASARLDAKFNEIIASANLLFKEEKFEAALDSYREAATLKPVDEYAKSQILKTEAQLTLLAQKQQTESRFNLLIGQAIEEEKNGQLQSSLQLFTEAAVLKPEDAFTKEKITTLENAIKRKHEAEQQEADYANFLASAKSFYEAQKYEEAVSNYEQALLLKPNSAETLSLLKAARQKIESQKATAAMEEKYNQIIREADLLFEKSEFADAIKKYKDALQIKADAEYPAAQISIAGKQLDAIAQAQQKTLRINALTAEADQYYTLGKLTEANQKYKEIIEVDSENSHASQRIALIAQTLENQAKERQANYEAAMAKAEQLMAVKEYKQSLTALNEALGYKPDNKTTLQKIKQVETIIEERLLALKTEYNKFISEADRFYNAKSYDQAIEKYLTAEGIKPDESYPREMIKKIAAEMEANKIREVNSLALIIPANTSKRFEFEPVDITERRSNYILIKARNTGEKSFPLLINFGSKSGRNGGFVLPIPENGEVNDFIVRIGQQYKWFSEDNTWLELLPENGSVEVTIIQISKSN